MKQQKLVIKVPMNKPKSRSKALKVVVGFSGFVSATLQEQNQIEVTGDDIDVIKLANLLKKKLGCMELVSMVLVEEKKEEKKETKEEKKESHGENKEAAKTECQAYCPPYCYCVACSGPQCLYVVKDYDPPLCSFL